MPEWAGWLLATLFCLLFSWINMLIKYDARWNNIEALGLRVVQMALMYGFLVVGCWWFIRHDGYLDFSASLLMIAGVLGPGDFSRTHMTQVIIDLLEGHLPASIDGGYNDFDIRDVADVLPAILERAEDGETYLFANKPDKINEVLSYVHDCTGRPMPKTMPLWLGYVFLPLLWVSAKLSHTRPLYTSAALASLASDANFPIDKAVERFGYTPRPLAETVRDHVDFLVEQGFTAL
jgi:nucleoside-diphosphate-sugar epimerase